MKELKITNQEYHKLRDIVYENFGINLTEAKKQLLVSRLQGVLRKYGFKNFESYYQYVVHNRDGNALSELIDQISTSYTFFYREKEHFDFFINTVLSEITDKLRQENSNDIRLWCAGCATGEEPYTIIMLMMNYLKERYNSWNSGILATDISNEALDYAKEAVYPKERMGQLSQDILKKYFTIVKDEDYKLIDRVIKEVTFRRFNLMNTDFPFKTKFHVIFCRNVMIYFDAKTRSELINRLADVLLPGGYLFVGHSESVETNYNFEYVRHAVYRKK